MTRLIKRTFIICRVIGMRAEWRRYFDGTDGKTIFDSRGSLLEALPPWEELDDMKQRTLLRAMRRNTIKAIELLAGLDEGVRRMGNRRNQQLNQIFTLRRYAALNMVIKREEVRSLQDERGGFKRMLDAWDLMQLAFILSEGEWKLDHQEVINDPYFCADVDEYVGERIEYARLIAGESREETRWTRKSIMEIYGLEERRERFMKEREKNAKKKVYYAGSRVEE